jgi:hypothetical protein
MHRHRQYIGEENVSKRSMMQESEKAIIMMDVQPLNDFIFDDFDTLNDAVMMRAISARRADISEVGAIG